MDKKERKAIYFECYGGISGDMTVAALLDMGADEKELRRQLDSLPLEGFSVEISRVKKSGLDCCDFNVVLEEQYHNHDHDIVYLYGHRQGEIQTMRIYTIIIYIAMTMSIATIYMVMSIVMIYMVMRNTVIMQTMYTAA